MNCYVLPLIKSRSVLVFEQHDIMNTGLDRNNLLATSCQVVCFC